jgi:cytochrome c oxidase subunit II
VNPVNPTNMFLPATTPARWIFDLSIMVYAITGVIFVVVFSLLIYSIVKFRKRKGDDAQEPAQVYGSTQIELAWTLIPILIVVVLFLATARVVAYTQRPRADENAVQVTVVGHQFWWEYRYPGTGVVTANELHIPATVGLSAAPTVLKLYSADTDHSFWVPRLAGKTDLIPNFPNTMWMDPKEPGLYLGQCAQYCGTQHAKMLLRVYVDTPEDFAKWIEAQRRPAVADPAVARGKQVFERITCMSCHAVAGTPATGRFGPDLTHLMSRETLGAGIIPNTRENLRAWIKDPSAFKPGVLMPAMGLSDDELDAVTDYLMTLR